MAEPRVLRVGLHALTLSVRDHGGGSPPVLALHGLASNARWWDLVAAHLVPQHRVLAPDLRGHGLSDKPETGYGFDVVVADLVELCDRLELPPLVVAGHSWGAWVALAFAGAAPHRCLGVVCVDGGAADLRAHFGPDWLVAQEAMRPPELRGVTGELLRTWVQGNGLAEGSDPDTAATILLGNFEPEDESGTTLRPRLSLDRHMQIARALYELDGAQLLRPIRCPLLFVPAGSRGAAEPWKVAAVETAMGQLGERATVTWVEGGHDLPVQRPAEVAAAISLFLNGGLAGERLRPG